MSKFTPGPWKACGYGDYGDYEGRCCIVLGDGGTVRVAAVMGHQEEAEADARLISAAPEMLHELYAAAAQIEALGGDARTQRAVIAKAEGQQ